MKYSWRAWNNNFFSGHLIIFEVFTLTNEKIALNDIPQEVIDPNDSSYQTKYKLLGVVDYCGPSVSEVTEMSRRREKSLGHYRAIVRRGALWIVYDDMAEHETTLKRSSLTTVPELVFYSKV